MGVEQKLNAREISTQSKETSPKNTFLFTQMPKTIRDTHWNDAPQNKCCSSRRRRLFSFGSSHDEAEASQTHLEMR